MELFQENVIITGHWNVPLISQIWLADHNIVSREEFLAAQSIFTPPMVQIATPQFQLLVLEERLQFTPSCEELYKAQLIIDRVGSLVNWLPETPYTGLGINFVWHYRPSAPATISSVGRRLFFKEDSPLAREFNTDDAKFGGYYSKNTLGFRLKLSTAPVDVQRTDRPTEEVVQFSFNYHLSSAIHHEIHRALGLWTDAKAHSVALTEAIEEAA